jgi:succinate dehydrogenase/fumarate reductase flavoprotein subunit
MRSETATVLGIQVPLFSVNTLVIGSGAAALKAAGSLHERGQRNLAIVTDRWGGGTSNNSGSDKQTYYKLSLAGGLPDSPLEMARDLFKGGCMHGDIALCEAQHSAQAFYDLVSAGVPFPCDRYGGYPGYRTDHDPRGRATSAGPRTSQYMFQALAKRVQEAGVPIFDRHPVIALLTAERDSEKKVIGAAALSLEALEQEGFGLTLFNATNVVLATGGPGGLYEMSVYPEDQMGSIGLALRIGAVVHNLTESQFGLASVRPRWNLSGSYQQVMPRYVSTDASGGSERDFLSEYFPNLETMAAAIFRKGYQWPFDPRKVADWGSSTIDLAVYRETALRGRRVYLDFMHNPAGGPDAPPFMLTRVPEEPRQYLERSGALQSTPIERLANLNPPAIDLYKAHGVDLSRDCLEIAVCAQHNNGGLLANHWWESNIKHLFPVGEVNGTHGVYRPGGAALNAGQVGALRAAMFICHEYADDPADISYFVANAEEQLTGILDRAMRWLTRSAGKTGSKPDSCISGIRQRMTRHGAHVRNPRDIRDAVMQAWRAVSDFENTLMVQDPNELPQAFKAIELALAHAFYLEAIQEYLDRGGKSRSSYLIMDPDGDLSCSGMGNDWRFSLTGPDAFVSRHILELSMDSTGQVLKNWVPVRPIPTVDPWFENVWRDFLDGKNYTEGEASP